MSEKNEQELREKSFAAEKQSAPDKKKTTFFQKLSSPEWATARKWIHFIFTALPMISIFMEIFAPICDVYVINSFYTLRASDALKYLDDTKFGAYAYLPAAFLLVLILCAILIFALMVICLVSFHNEKKMMRSAKTTLTVGAIVSVLCPSIGLFSPTVIYTVRGNLSKVNTSFTAVIVMTVLVISYAVFLGMVGLGQHQRKEDTVAIGADERRSKLLFKLLCRKIELAVYVIGVSAVSIVALLSNIITLSIESNSVIISNHPISGMSLLANPQELPTVGERMLAFFVFAMLIICAAFAVMSIVSLVSRSVFYPKVSVATAIICTTSSLLVGLFGSYYKIVRYMNIETIRSIVSQYSQRADEIVNELIGYKVESSAIWWFVACLGILGVLFFRRPYTAITELEAQIAAEDAAMLHHSVDISSINDEASDESGDSSVGAEVDPEKPLETVDMPKPDFDPCPIFTEIDAEVAALRERRAMLFESPTLPQLVEFIVQYARNSRNHLFYTRESIAAFLAGLGSTRLTILQGMSGTGKTSLPKIVSEALGSVCDIVEVESSWRDKNELLGYYNEFSKMYTPKKFTRALYRARLCPDRLTFIVLDEMNLSRIEYYFSDFLSLMENDPDKRELRLINLSVARTENGEQIPYAGLCNGHT